MVKRGKPARLDQCIEALIDEVRAFDPLLASTLARFADNRDYGRIALLAEVANSRNTEKGQDLDHCHATGSIDERRVGDHRAAPVRAAWDRSIGRTARVGGHGPT